MKNILDTKNTGDISGIKFAQQLRKYEDYLFAPIIFSTCLEDPKLYVYRDLHSFGYLEKPVKMKEVIKQVKDALRYPGNNKKDEQVYWSKDRILYSFEIDKIIYLIRKSFIQEIMHGC